MKVYVEEGAFVPTKAHEADAGFDIYSPESFIVYAGESFTVDTKVHIDIPFSCVGMIKSRSGLHTKHGIITEGVIDAGYSGSIKIRLNNLSPVTYKVERGDRIAQLVVMPIVVTEMECVQSTASFGRTGRDDNGFGSSGR